MDATIKYRGNAASLHARGCSHLPDHDSLDVIIEPTWKGFVAACPTGTTVRFVRLDCITLSDNA